MIITLCVTYSSSSYLVVNLGDVTVIMSMKMDMLILCVLVVDDESHDAMCALNLRFVHND